MLKKTFITLGLLVATMLSGCVVYGRPRAVVYAPAPVVVCGPVIPVYGVYGGWGWGYHGGGRWR